MLLQLHSVGVQRGGRTVLQGVNLNVLAGEFIAVVGPNGAGKSSLIKAVTGEWPAVGQVLFDGRAVPDWRRDALARRLAVMTQQATLSFDFTVQEVVALGRLPHRGAGAAVDRAVVAEVLAELQLLDFAERSYLALSGGERQRVQFGRVVAQLWRAQAPGLLLLDEPTSALDLAQQRSVLGLAQRLSRQGIAVLAVLHDLNLAARHASRVLMLHRGHVAALGTPHQVLEPAQIEAVFGVPVQRHHSALDGRPVLVISA